ncbi:hypothetical protein DAT35_53650 [Vitiosangium sp. GDMCC 1.1324]|nr:hypothetical protein DAT35_53650 [Vitiosangium sp. GDMCC 1.1324]
MDRWLSEELRRAPPDERGRARVVAGSAITLLLLTGSTTMAFLMAGMPWRYFVGGGTTTLCYLGMLRILRRASSTRLPALLLSAIMSSGFVMTALITDDSNLMSHAAGMLITVLTVYLLGPRRGLLILVPMSLVIVVVQPLWHQTFGSRPPAAYPDYEWVMHALAGLCIVAGWAVGWLYSSAHAATHAELARDIQARKEAEAKLGELHHTLLAVSRQAGMTEIATGVLHNVGNTLNSVNISVGVVTDRLRGSRISKLVQATGMLSEHSTDLPAFLTTDPRGTMLPAYLSALSQQLTEERAELLAEMNALGEGVEHIKSIVSMQQQHARLVGVVELITVPQLIDDALRLDAGAFEQSGIEVRCEYAEVPPIVVDRHKLLQILLNLLSNARHALVDSSVQDKRLTIRVGPGAGGRHLRIEVTDNGLGIAPENLTRVFSQGFTTKRGGHGFGLHMSALAAEELKGRLTATSAGPGQGATFTVELPFRAEEALASVSRA